jgi:hypothetical protein
MGAKEAAQIEHCKGCDYRLAKICDPLKKGKTFRHCPHKPQAKPKREEKKKWEQESLFKGGLR